MKAHNAGMALVLLSAAWAMPAAAEMPTQSGLTAEQMQHLQEAARVHDTIIAMHTASGGTAFAQLEGKPVFGSQGRELGAVIAVDYASQLAQVYMADEGMSVALPLRMLTAEGNRVVAPTVSKADALQMVDTQARTTLFAAL